jgi:hypothetical protein
MVVSQRRISVQVADDHLQKLAASKRAIDALSELVWNSLDADASLVTIDIIENGLSGIDQLVVKDNGCGFSPSDLDNAFTNLGNSWKKRETYTRMSRRILHGKEGQGRYKALSLGLNVKWRTTWRDPASGALRSHLIMMSRNDLRIASVEEIDDHFPEPGTSVFISDVDRKQSSFFGVENTERFAEDFSLYLLDYPGIRLSYLGVEIDPQKQIANRQEYESTYEYDGDSYQCSLSIIEWNLAKQRALMLCRNDAFTLKRVKPGVQAPGFSFTAYLKSDFLEKMQAEGYISVEDMHPGLDCLLNQTREVLRTHFRRRMAELAKSQVDEWKEKNIYPYKDEPINEVAKSERQVFDILALNVSEYAPGFNSSDSKVQALSFRLLREAVEESPDTVQRIIAEVLELPQEKSEQLARLLDKTSLSSIINSSKEVADRLDFLRGLEVLLFEDEAKQKVLERKHLHRILAKHTWLFGEEFSLSVDDQSLDAVLNKHLELIRGEEKIGNNETGVTLIDGSRGIVDLMLSRRIPQPRAEEREHLVIELKRPSQKLTEEVVSQIMKYAFAVAEDERFKDTRTKWHFMAICNEMDKTVERRARNKNMPFGLIHDDPDIDMKIWVKTWSHVLDSCKGRLHFFQQRLEYDSQRSDALEYLNELYAIYLPTNLQLDKAVA